MLATHLCSSSSTEGPVLLLLVGSASEVGWAPLLLIHWMSIGGTSTSRASTSTSRWVWRIRTPAARIRVGGGRRGLLLLLLLLLVTALALEEALCGADNFGGDFAPEPALLLPLRGGGGGGGGGGLPGRAQRIAVWWLL